MFFIIGIIIAVFLEFLLLIKKNKSKADKILAIWLAIMAIHQFLHYFQYSGAVFEYPYLLGIEFPLPVMHGIMLFLYVSELTNQRLKKHNKYLVYLPLFIVIALSFNFYLLSTEEKLYIFKNNGEGYETEAIIYNILIVVSGLLFTILSFIKIERHKKNVQQIFSDTHKKDLTWLKLLNLGLGVIWLLVVFFYGYIIFLGMAAFVIVIGFFGINQLNIFSAGQNINNIANSNIETTSKNKDSQTITKRYAKSGLTEEKAEEIYTKLNVLMYEKSVYKSENINLVELANMIEVHPNHLSQVINEKEQKNFYHYINAHRIKEFIKLASLPENKKYTLTHLAYDCGFNSKSTFNKHFKIITKKTPTEYFQS